MEAGVAWEVLAWLLTDTTHHSMTAMTSSIAVVTGMARPRWYTMRSWVV